MTRGRHLNKRTIVFVTGVLLAALILLAYVAHEPVTVGGTSGPAAGGHRSDFAAAPRGVPITRRVTVETDRPMALGLPPWTILLPTMPASPPPPLGAAPPEVPERALVPPAR